MSDIHIQLLSTGDLSLALIDEAAAKGIFIDAIPFIETEPVKHQRLEALLQRPLVAIFTSKNAVKAMGDEGGRDWKIYCIGKTEVAARFGEDAIAGYGASAKELAEKMIRTNDGREVYFFCGDRRRDELPDLLRKEGFIVHELTVYRTVETPQRLARPYNGIAFFSPSAVESFFSVNAIASGVPLFAIGETTAEAIRRRCTNLVLVGTRPDKEGLIRMMIEYFQYE